METEYERLDIVGAAGTSRGITHMADGAVAGKPLDFALVVEHLGEQSLAAMPGELSVVVRNDARTLLAAMLQGMKAEIGKSGCVGVTPDAEDAAFLVNVFKLSGQTRTPLRATGFYVSTLPIRGNNTDLCDYSLWASAVRVGFCHFGRACPVSFRANMSRPLWSMCRSLSFRASMPRLLSFRAEHVLLYCHFERSERQ